MKTFRRKNNRPRMKHRTRSRKRKGGNGKDRCVSNMPLFFALGFLITTAILQRNPRPIKTENGVFIPINDNYIAKINNVIAKHNIQPRCPEPSINFDSMIKIEEGVPTIDLRDINYIIQRINDKKPKVAKELNDELQKYKDQYQLDEEALSNLNLEDNVQFN